MYQNGCIYTESDYLIRSSPSTETFAFKGISRYSSFPRFKHFRFMMWILNERGCGDGIAFFNKHLLDELRERSVGEDFNKIVNAARQLLLR